MDVIQEIYVKIDYWYLIIWVPSQYSLQNGRKPAEIAGPTTYLILISSQQSDTKTFI